MVRQSVASGIFLTTLVLMNVQSLRLPSAFAQGPVMSGQIIRVPEDYLAIQDAVNAATDGDTVLVSPDTYYEIIDFRGRAIVVRSTSGPELTTIDGCSLDSVVTFDSGEEASSVIEGFTIQNGRATKGGGIYCDGSSPIIRNNRIILNYAVEPDPPGGGGGGIYCGSSSCATIVNNTIANNSANGSGGGICFNLSSPVIDRNLIIENAGGLEGGGGQGGGIAGYGASTAVISSNLIIKNSAATVEPGMFDVGGGGISLDDCGSGIVVVNNTIDANRTVYGHGGGIFCDFYASPTIKNNIITSSPVGEGIWVSDLGADPIIDYNDVWNNANGDYGGAAQAGQHDTSVDPLFVDLQNDNYHLQPASFCVDAGDNSASCLPPTDFDGDERIVDGDDDGTATVDMGGDECVPIGIDKLRHRRCEPGDRIGIIGRGFGDAQGSSIVHIGKREFDSSSPRIKLWTDSKIKIKIPKYKCKWFKGQEDRKQKTWVTVHGIDSNKKQIKVVKPDKCE